MSNTVPFFYLKEPFKFAFEGNDSLMIITDDGSVYKDSVTPDNLVVNGSGEIGLAGGGNAIAKINDINTGAISNMLEYTRQLSQFFLKQLNLQTASENFLDFLGTQVYGIARIGGEIDSVYADRIVQKILEIKTTLLSLRDALLPYANTVIITDGPSTGAFADVTFSDFYILIPGPPVITQALAGAVSGLIFHFIVDLDGVDIADGQTIVNIIETFRPAGITYDIIVRSFL